MSNNAPKTGSWAGLAGMNISKRKNLNVLEIRLEKEDDANFSLKTMDVEKLLAKIGLRSSHITAV